MTNFTINFVYPWLLLLLIPAIAIILIPYFRLAKRYRRTRNRIISVVLHLIVMVMCISVLAGMTFSYQIPNTESELIILVDASYSSNIDSADTGFINEEKEDFINDIIASNRTGIKVGIVTFGYNQVYAAKLSNNSKEVMQQFMMAEMPDMSATDIASALKFTRELFENPKSSKIVLLSDGIETDNEAKAVIKSVVSDGIIVDTVVFENEPVDAETNKEVQIIDVVTPDYNVTAGDPCIISVTLQSSFSGVVEITLEDEDISGDTTKVGPIAIEVEEGIQTFEFEHTFAIPNMHTLMFSISSDSDKVVSNNEYYSYMFLETFDDILIVEKYSGESDKLKALLVEAGYNVFVANVEDPTSLPLTLNELRDYDQVILVNIANADLPVGIQDTSINKKDDVTWAEVLHAYVHDIGGGLFTVGGNKDGEFDAYGNPRPNAYNRDDMVGTLYQRMLPVDVIDYTPPLGLMLIIDRSGSMSSQGDNGKTKLELAKEAAISALYALSERDWCGLITLETTYTQDVQMIPMPKMANLVSAIESIVTGGGTIFTGAIERAGLALAALNSVERKHIILITDGAPGDSFEQYGPVIERYYQNHGITFSLIAIGISSSAVSTMEEAVKLGNGRFYNVAASQLQDKMREELMGEAIKAVSYETFTPFISNYSSPLIAGLHQADMPTLDGYYGTKAREGADVVLSADYVPIYAQWKYGMGMVGSFLCDLNGTWSADFISDPTGKAFIYNVIENLFPATNIRASEFAIDIIEDNYGNNMSIYTTLEIDQTVRMTITDPTGETIEVPLSEDNNYSRVKFSVTTPGVHKIYLEKLDVDGNTVADYTDYKTFSYSEEYNMFVDSSIGKTLMTDIATLGNGKSIATDSAWDVYEGFVETLDKTYDPRVLFMILSLILFLLEIAVRKFRFKWIHEIVRDHKNKKQLFNQQ